MKKDDIINSLSCRVYSLDVITSNIVNFDSHYFKDGVLKKRLRRGQNVITVNFSLLDRDSADTTWDNVQTELSSILQEIGVFNFLICKLNIAICSSTKFNDVSRKFYRYFLIGFCNAFGIKEPIIKWSLVAPIPFCKVRKINLRLEWNDNKLILGVFDNNGITYERFSSAWYKAIDKTLDRMQNPSEQTFWRKYKEIEKEDYRNLRTFMSNWSDIIFTKKEAFFYLTRLNYKPKDIKGYIDQWNAKRVPIFSNRDLEIYSNEVKYLIKSFFGLVNKA